MYHGVSFVACAPHCGLTFVDKLNYMEEKMFPSLLLYDNCIFPDTDLLGSWDAQVGNV